MGAEQLKQQQKHLNAYANLKKEGTLPLPEDLSQFDTPGLRDMFKMMAILNHGSSEGWKIIREDFIKKSAGNAPQGKNLDSMNATLLAAVKNKGISQEDQIMNDFAMDTNKVIEQIHDGTVDLAEGKEKLQKMQMLEGDMPGQGKQKQGNWRG